MEAQSNNDSPPVLQGIVESILAREGLELVELVQRGATGRRVLRLDIDRAGPDGVNVDDCQRVSEALSLALDEADSIPGGYTLEVSSPGTDRPIRTADDIRRNVGRLIAVTATDPDGTSRDYRGPLRGENGGCLLLDDEACGPTRIPLQRIVRAQQEVAF